MRAVVLAFVAGCYSPAYRDCEVTCANGTCPSGLQCTAGYCRSPNAPGTCGTGSDAAQQDAPPPIDAPYPTGPWGTPSVVDLTGITAPGDPTLTEDMLEMYLRVAGDIYTTTRATAGDPWAPPTVVLELSSTSEDQTPSVSTDGLMIVFASNRPPLAGDVDLWVSTRSVRGTPWGTPVRIDELATPDGDYGASISYDKRTLYLTKLPAGGTSDLYVTTRASEASPWGLPQIIQELAMSGYDSHPSISGDQRTLFYFHTDTAPDDLYVATRSAIDKPFAAAPITELNTGARDTDPWVSPDGHTMFFVSNSSGADLMYTTTR